VIARETNYISVVVSNLMLIGREMLIVSAYAPPDTDDWKRILWKFEEDLRLVKNRFGVTNAIMMADLNVDIK
jgi:hypothetical protein